MIFVSWGLGISQRRPEKQTNLYTFHRASSFQQTTSFAEPRAEQSYGQSRLGHDQQMLNHVSLARLLSYEY